MGVNQHYPHVLKQLEPVPIHQHALLYALRQYQRTVVVEFMLGVQRIDEDELVDARQQLGTAVGQGHQAQQGSLLVGY